VGALKLHTKGDLNSRGSLDLRDNNVRRGVLKWMEYKEEKICPAGARCV